MNFTKKRLLCFGTAITVIVIMVCLFLAAEKRVYADIYGNITSSSIEAKKNEIKDAQKEFDNIQSNIDNMTKQINALKGKKKDLNNYISTIDKNVSNIETNIHSLEEQISVKETELSDARAQEESQYASMQKRIQYLYENGSTSYIDVILNSTSFADMLNRAEYVENIASYDNQMLHSFILQREYIELCKESLEESKKALDVEKANLQNVRAEKVEVLAAYEHDIQLTADQIKELEEDLAYQTSIIESLEKEITDEQRAILAASGITLGYDGSGFANPAPKYYSITSPFGWRKDPFTGLSAYHNGIDMGAAKGTPIVAAFDGIVGEASYNGSMGNYIYLEHGNGLRTIYLHAEKLYVKKNDVVLKGETIASVGSTGRSTGPHLHFSVRLNGEYVDPTLYIKFK